MICKKTPNCSCTQAYSHCATGMCTIGNQLVKGINKFTRGHANVFIKIIIHAPSRTKT